MVQKIPNIPLSENAPESLKNLDADSSGSLDAQEIKQIESLKPEEQNKEFAATATYIEEQFQEAPEKTYQFWQGLNRFDDNLTKKVRAYFNVSGLVEVEISEDQRQASFHVLGNTFTVTIHKDDPTPLSQIEISRIEEALGKLAENNRESLELLAERNQGRGEDKGLEFIYATKQILNTQYKFKESTAAQYHTTIDQILLMRSISLESIMHEINHAIDDELLPDQPRNGLYYSSDLPSHPLRNEDAFEACPEELVIELRNEYRKSSTDQSRYWELRKQISRYPGIHSLYSCTNSVEYYAETSKGYDDVPYTSLLQIVADRLKSETASADEIKAGLDETKAIYDQTTNDPLKSRLLSFWADILGLNESEKAATNPLPKDFLEFALMKIIVENPTYAQQNAKKIIQRIIDLDLLLLISHFEAQRLLNSLLIDCKGSPDIIYFALDKIRNNYTPAKIISIDYSKFSADIFSRSEDPGRESLLYLLIKDSFECDVKDKPSILRVFFPNKEIHKILPWYTINNHKSLNQALAMVDENLQLAFQDVYQNETDDSKKAELLVNLVDDFFFDQGLRLPKTTGLLKEILASGDIPQTVKEEMQSLKSPDNWIALSEIPEENPELVFASKEFLGLYAVLVKKNPNRSEANLYVQRLIPSKSKAPENLKEPYAKSYLNALFNTALLSENFKDPMFQSAQNHELKAISRAILNDPDNLHSEFRNYFAKMFFRDSSISDAKKREFAYYLNAKDSRWATTDEKSWKKSVAAAERFLTKNNKKISHS